jgi:hypothetical protein
MNVMDELDAIAVREVGNNAVAFEVGERIKLIARTICEAFNAAEVEGHLIATEVLVPFARINLSARREGRVLKDRIISVQLFEEERGHSVTEPAPGHISSPSPRFVRIDAQGSPYTAAAIAVAHEVGKVVS